MKVLLVNSVCGIGSTGRICTDLATALEKDGHEAKIAYGRIEFVPDQYKKYAIKICGYQEVKINGVTSRLLDNHGFGLKHSTRSFIDWMQDYDPDIIHLHNVHGYYLNVEVLFDFLKTWDKPVIWTLHDCWSFTGHCVYFDYVGCDQWRTGCIHCPQKKTYPASMFLDRSKENYEKKKQIFCGVKNLTIVTPSEWLAGLVKESYLRDYNVEVVNNGIDTDVFRSTESSLRDKYNLRDKKVILGVSLGWAPHKHLDYMLRLADDLGNQYQVVLIGLSEEQKTTLPKNVIGFQKTRNVQELVEWYSAADVYVNPTMEDNYPTVNLEAQACGTPVVTFKSGGSAECIKDGYGVAVERGSYEGLAESVIQTSKIKGNVPVPSIMGKQEFAEIYLKLYDKLLS